MRHARVAAPHEGTFYGCADVALSEQGRIEGRRLAERLAADPPQQVWSSPLSRARLLAQDIAARAGATLVFDPLLRELDRGSWTHRARFEIEASQPGALARYAADPETGNAPDGERESELCARVWATLDRLAALQPGRDVVVVCHAHVIRVAMRRLLGWDAPTSLCNFVPCLAVVEARLLPGGGTLVSAPETMDYDALLRV